MDAENFKLALKKLGLTQKQFAELTGYHQDSIGRFAQGKEPIPKHIAWLLREIENNAAIIGTIQEIIRVWTRRIENEIKKGHLEGRHQAKTGKELPSYRNVVKLIEELKNLVNSG